MQNQYTFLKGHLLILTLQLALPILSTDIYLPSLDEMKQYFNASRHQVQLTLTVYFLCLGLSQLFYGPLSDRFGRKPLLVLSLILYFMATLFCLTACSIEGLILGRGLQGLGAGSAMLTFAIIRDRYDKQQAIKTIAYMSSVVAISPIVAPIMGSYIQTTLSWQWNFWLLGMISFLLLVASLRWLPETNLYPRRGTSLFKQGVSDYQQLLQNTDFLAHALSAAFAFGALFTYVCGAPYVLFTFLEGTSQHFGWIFAIPASGYVLGAFLNGYFISHVGMTTMWKLGIICLIGGALLSVLAYYLFAQNILVFIIPQILCEFGISIIISTSIPRALHTIPIYAGAGSALIGFFRFIVAALSSYVLLIPGSPTPLTIGLCILGLALLSFASSYMHKTTRHGHLKYL